MPLERKCIVKLGNLVKSPQTDSLNRRWKLKYFVLYDPNLSKSNSLKNHNNNYNITQRTASNTSRNSSGSDNDLKPPPQPKQAHTKRRRKSSFVTETILRHFQHQQSFDGSEFTTPMLFIFDDAEKEMQGATPKSKLKHVLLGTHNTISLKWNGWKRND